MRGHRSWLQRTNKCSVCVQSGHNKNSILCAGRSDIGSFIIPISAQDIAVLDENLSEAKKMLLMIFNRNQIKLNYKFYLRYLSYYIMQLNDTTHANNVMP